MKSKSILKLKNNFKVTFEGEPSSNVKKVKTSSLIGVSPLKYNFIKAKLVVKEGDLVKKGQALFFDKKNPQVYFHSPVSGNIKAIHYGPQRRLDLIEIKTTDGDALEFKALDIKKCKDVEFKSALLERGLWTGFNELPFNNIPCPSKNPPAIIISLSNTEPFQPKLSSVLDDVESDIIDGIKWLKKLSPNIRLHADANERFNLDLIGEEAQVVRVNGDFSSNGSAVVNYHLKTSKDENSSWTCDWQHLVKISQTLRTGEYSSQSIISVGGNQTDDNQHYFVSEGIQLNKVFKLNDSTNRVICGGLFSGLHLDNPQFLPLGINAINIIDSDPQTEFLSFMQLGVDKPSFSRAYLSGAINEAARHLKKLPLPLFENLEQLTKTTTSVNGSQRDCISCGFCEVVCPVDSVPQTLLRNSKVNDVEEGMRMGLLDCSGCGACTYVCPSKIDLASIFVEMKNNLYKELNI